MLISPRDKPDGREKDRETIEDRSFWCDLYLPECDHQTRENPENIDNSPYGESHSSWRDSGRKYIRDISLIMPSERISEHGNARPRSEEDSEDRRYQWKKCIHT